MRISTNSEVETKKKSLRPQTYVNFHEFWGKATKTNRVYCKISERTVLAHEFWGDIQYFGESQASNSTPAAPSLLISSGHNPRLGGGTILVWEAQAVIWAGTAPECPPWRRACFGVWRIKTNTVSHMRNRIVDLANWALWAT